MKKIDTSGPESVFAKTVMLQKYAHVKGGQKEDWGQIARRVSRSVMKAVEASKDLTREVERLIAQRKFMPGGRYLAAAGRQFHQVNNCLLMRAEDSREGWAEHGYRNRMGLMSGAGIGTVYSDLRAEGKPIRKTGGFSTGPLALMQMTNEDGRFIRQGGDRRSALWGGLHWNHPDIMKFIHAKDLTRELREMKLQDFNFPTPLDGTNISDILDDDFFAAYHDEKHPQHALARAVYWETVERMLKTAEPGFSVDVGVNKGENLRNACTELTSRDDSDICNIGSVVLSRIESVDEMRHVVEVAVAFLTAGTVYSDVPYAKVDQIRTKNRRLGLGLMGVHEWLLSHGRKYGPDPGLEEMLKVYATSGEYANKYADEWSLSRPVKTRAMAPNGTIAIVAETSSCLEPILCKAYKRRYLKGDTWSYQYVIDPTAKRIIEQGHLDPDNVEDAYTLATDVERRVAFQAWFQQYVDHGISSTVNLPPWGSELNNADRVQNFGNMLLKYLPKLRGITCYPDGARGGQPLTPVRYQTAVKHLGEEFSESGEKAVIEQGDVCELSKGATCG